MSVPSTNGRRNCRCIVNWQTLGFPTSGHGTSIWVGTVPKQQGGVAALLRDAWTNTMKEREYRYEKC